MDIPQPVIGKLVEIASNAGFRILEGYVQNSTTRREVPQEIKDTPCKVCQIFQHAALASAYIEGLHKRLNSDGSIPAGLGGTIPLASEHLRDIMMEIPEVMGAHPAIDSACRDLSILIPPLAARMANIKSDEDWKFILSNLKLVENAAYSVPEAMYRREPQRTPEQDQVIVILTPDEKETLDIMTARRKNEITDEEARTKLGLRK